MGRLFTGTSALGGIAKDFPCRWKYEHGSFTEERSEDFGVAGLFLFEEKSALKDIPEQGEFVRWLKGQAYKGNCASLHNHTSSVPAEPECAPVRQLLL